MKKKVLIVAFFICTVVCVSAQTSALFRLNYSIDWNRMSNMGDKTKAKFSPLNFGLTVDVEPNVANNEHWSYSSGVFFQNKRAENLSLNYITVPLTLNYRIPVIKSKLSLYASAGGYGAYAVSEKTDITGLECNKFDTGLHFSLTLGSAQYPAGLKIEYQYGLLDIVKNNIGTKVSNGTLFLTVIVYALPINF